MSNLYLREYVEKTPRSRQLHERACKVLPAGVSYSIRFYEPYPFFAASAQGTRVLDVDGNEYVDFWLGHTALILGHSHPEVVEAVNSQLKQTSHFGVPHEPEVELAERIAEALPSIEMLRFTNSGTEASMYSARLCRAHTGRAKLAKFIGGWHGGYDSLHVGTKPPLREDQSAGLPPSIREQALLLPFNDLEGTESLLKKEGREVAAVYVEPVQGAGGAVPAERAFLRGLRELCDEIGALLVFDEVMTGFRLGYRGGQGFYGVTPDVTILGKIIGGGFPIGAFGARREIIEKVDPRGKKPQETSFHGGTFTGNPVSCAAGKATLDVLRRGPIYEHINALGAEARKRLQDAFDSVGLDAEVTGEGSLFQSHFTGHPVRSAEDALTADRDLLRDYHTYLIRRGILFLPTHAGALAAMHSLEDVKRLVYITEDFAREAVKKRPR